MCHQGGQGRQQAGEEDAGDAERASAKDEQGRQHVVLQQKEGQQQDQEEEEEEGGAGEERDACHRQAEGKEHPSIYDHFIPTDNSQQFVALNNA